MTDINFYSAVALPGDTLIVAAPNIKNKADAAEFAANLEGLLPGIRVVLVDAQQIAIYRGETDPQ